MKALYAKKTKALLHTIATLEEELRRTRAATKEHKRSALIAALQEHAHEREKVIEVLKAALCTSAGRSPEEVDEFVHKKLTGAPKMFAPRSREEMGLELASLQKELEAARATIKKLEVGRLAAHRATGAGVERGGHTTPHHTTPLRCAAGARYQFDAPAGSR